MNYTANTKANPPVEQLTRPPVAYDCTEAFCLGNTRKVKDVPGCTPLGVQQSGLVLTEEAPTEFLAVGVGIQLKFGCDVSPITQC